MLMVDALFPFPRLHSTFSILFSLLSLSLLSEDRFSEQIKHEITQFIAFLHFAHILQALDTIFTCWCFINNLEIISFCCFCNFPYIDHFSFLHNDCFSIYY